jgi:hypothetical protein
MSATFPARNGSMSTQPPGNLQRAAYTAQMLKLRRTQEFRLPRCLRQLAKRQVVTSDRPHPTVEVEPDGSALCQSRPRRPCHYRAIHSSLDRSPADTDGQDHDGRDLRPSPHPQLANLPNLGFGSRRSVGRGLYRSCRPTGRSGCRPGLAGIDTHLERSAHTRATARERHRAERLVCWSRTVAARVGRGLDEKASTVTVGGAGRHGHGGEPSRRHHLR